MNTILVTGGAGFIGSHTVDALVARGDRVRVLDSLDPQVHGPAGQLPAYWNPRAELVPGSVLDAEVWDRALDGVEAVLHLAAAVGVGQSMYEIRRYVAVNTQATALLLEQLIRRRGTIKRLVVASSMSVYGEGQYHCARCGPVAPSLRSPETIRRGVWEMACPACGQPVEPRPTTEEKPLHPTSVYAITKRDQEELSLVIGQAYGLPVIALRYFNIYGPRQALSNPYTGVVAIFSSRLRNGQPPMVFEDGRQTRDFIHVRDVARANLLALESPAATTGVFNIGTGRAVSLLTLCTLLQKALGQAIPPTIVGQFREGDIRHCYADTHRADEGLGFRASIAFEDGVRELAEWVGQQSAEDRVAQATQELLRQGLLKSPATE